MELTTSNQEIILVVNQLHLNVLKILKNIKQTS